MDDIKVSVTFTLQGRVLLTQEEANTLEKENVGYGYNSESVTIYNHQQKKKETFTFKTRKQRIITQTLNIGKEAYLYMISKDSCPSGITMFIWGKLNKQKRLEEHLKLIAKQLNGTLKEFFIFDD